MLTLSHQIHVFSLSPLLKTILVQAQWKACKLPFPSHGTNILLMRPHDRQNCMLAQHAHKFLDQDPLGIWASLPVLKVTHSNSELHSL